MVTSGNLGQFLDDPNIVRVSLLAYALGTRDQKIQDENKMIAKTKTDDENRNAYVLTLLKRFVKTKSYNLINVGLAAKRMYTKWNFKDLTVILDDT